MRLFSVKTFLEVLNQVFINLTSGWFGVVVISPGFFGVSSQEQYFELLIKHVPFGSRVNTVFRNCGMDKTL